MINNIFILIIIHVVHNDRSRGNAGFKTRSEETSEDSVLGREFTAGAPGRGTPGDGPRPRSPPGFPTFARLRPGEGRGPRSGKTDPADGLAGSPGKLRVLFLKSPLAWRPGRFSGIAGRQSPGLSPGSDLALSSWQGHPPTPPIHTLPQLFYRLFCGFSLKWRRRPRGESFSLVHGDLSLPWNISWG